MLNIQSKKSNIAQNSVAIVHFPPKRMPNWYKYEHSTPYQAHHTRRKQQTLMQHMLLIFQPNKPCNWKIFRNFTAIFTANSVKTALFAWIYSNFAQYKRTPYNAHARNTRACNSHVKHRKNTAIFCVTFWPQKFGIKTQKFSVIFSRRKVEKLFLAGFFPVFKSNMCSKTPLFSGFFAVLAVFRVSRETDPSKILFHVKLIIYS